MDGAAINTASENTNINILPHGSGRTIIPTLKFGHVHMSGSTISANNHSSDGGNIHFSPSSSSKVVRVPSNILSIDCLELSGNQIVSYDSDNNINLVASDNGLIKS